MITGSGQLTPCLQWEQFADVAIPVHSTGKALLLGKPFILVKLLFFSRANSSPAGETSSICLSIYLAGIAIEL